MRRLPLEASTMYAELVEQLTALEGARALGSASGTFVTKRVKGNEYYYFQFHDASGHRHQDYLGRRDDSLDEMVRRYVENKKAISADLASVARLAASLRMLGAAAADPASAKVIKALADAGIFRSGGLLVGTHAFLVLGNVLGVSWTKAGMMTQDIDLAAPKVLEVAATAPPTGLPTLVDSLEMGFLPVPGLDPKSPATSFKVKGQPLRIDLLTPALVRNRGPITIPRFAAAAQPLKYLDYLIEVPVRAALVSGDPALVFVPDPARFAIHKLIAASARPATETAKQHKDRIQSAQVLEVLFEDRPTDVQVAVEALGAKGKDWMRRVRGQLKHLPDEVARPLAVHLDRQD